MMELKARYEFLKALKRDLYKFYSLDGFYYKLMKTCHDDKNTVFVKNMKGRAIWSAPFVMRHRIFIIFVKILNEISQTLPFHYL